MEKRKLATVQYIHEISPIEGADKIECIHVLGWKCVANKGVFHVGDWCVYMEVDSFLPVCEQFEFLRKSSYKKSALMGEGFLLKTLRFKGQISQGLIQPMDILPKDREYKIGSDVTELLGIRKWEVEEKVTGSGTVVGNMPSGIPKTDEFRVQSYPSLLEEFKEVDDYYISTKMDGTSVTMYMRYDNFGVCGRNYEYADDGKCAMWEYAKKRNVEQLLRKNNISDIAIQGEFCGAGIQKNPLKLVQPEWYVFNVLDLNERRLYSLEEMRELCEKLQLNMVPIEEEGDKFPYSTIDELLERSKGKYSSGHKKEGIVIRPQNPVYSQTLGKHLSMKVINNDYLLK